MFLFNEEREREREREPDDDQDLLNWPLLPKFAGSKPVEAVGFFGRKNPQHALIQRGSKAVCPMSQLCGMLKNPTTTVEVAIVG
jgi:hypothetical protein